ncbi:hypothetical protein BWI15_02235 [Kribbella sp. ALI-6-A]|uniref:hypothetical protein n=1 Tax=Kribbella sp. ALI-6-A TaxID=1933817 RepID=UPI00097BC800|nr:hypothetical protein [Kribbella sp. ALI-6-A]ONI78314.1 hypothetical protein BWI15_02235 [Kribbella sp. ALI-6-A]
MSMLTMMPTADMGPGWVLRTKTGRDYKIVVRHPDVPKRAPWIGLPLEFWSPNRINVMSARALFAFLCLHLVLAG